MESSFTCLSFIWLCWVFSVTRGVFDSCGRQAPSCGTWDPWPGIEPGPLHWECGVLVTGPPEKSLVLHFTLATLKKKKKQVTLILTIFYLTLYAQMVIISIFIQYKELLMKYLTFFFFCLQQHHRLHGWVWTNSGSWWWTEKPGVLQSMGVQRVRHNWATELSWSLWNLVWILHP